MNQKITISDLPELTGTVEDEYMLPIDDGEITKKVSVGHFEEAASATARQYAEAAADSATAAAASEHDAEQAAIDVANNTAAAVQAANDARGAATRASGSADAAAAADVEAQRASSAAASSANSASQSATEASGYKSDAQAAANRAASWADYPGQTGSGDATHNAHFYADQAAAAIVGVASWNGRSGNVVPEDDDYNIGMMGDVAILNPLNDQILQYDNETQKWKNKPIYLPGKMDIDGSNAAEHVRFNGAFTVGSRATGSTAGTISTAEGSNVTASGESSHAEGNESEASGDYSHAEGIQVVASGDGAHSEGYSTTASGDKAHAEGSNTVASGECSHAEGKDTVSFASYSHAEGDGSTAKGQSAHAEGDGSFALAGGSHSEGAGCIAGNAYSGYEINTLDIPSNIWPSDELFQASVMFNNKLHVFGKLTHVVYDPSDGTWTKKNDYRSEAPYITFEGQGDAEVYQDTIKVYMLTASSIYTYTYTENDDSWTSSSISPHDQGNYFIVRSVAFNGQRKFFVTKSKTASASSGLEVKMVPGIASILTPNNKSNAMSVVEFNNKICVYDGVGTYTYLDDDLKPTDILPYDGGSVISENGVQYLFNSTACKKTNDGVRWDPIYDGQTGSTISASPAASLITAFNGNITTGWTGTQVSMLSESNTYSHGVSSHAEGHGTLAIGNYSHSEGRATAANGNYSHAEGDHTAAYADYQHVQGKYNIGRQNTLMEVGNGADGARHNALEVYDDGVVGVNSAEPDTYTFHITSTAAGTAVQWCNKIAKFSAPKDAEVGKAFEFSVTVKVGDKIESLQFDAGTNFDITSISLWDVTTAKVSALAAANYTYTKSVDSDKNIVLNFTIAASYVSTTAIADALNAVKNSISPGFACVYAIGALTMTGTVKGTGVVEAIPGLYYGISVVNNILPISSHSTHHFDFFLPTGGNRWRVELEVEPGSAYLVQVYMENSTTGAYYENRMAMIQVPTVTPLSGSMTSPVPVASSTLLYSVGGSWTGFGTHVAGVVDSTTRKVTTKPRIVFLNYHANNAPTAGLGMHVRMFRIY